MAVGRIRGHFVMRVDAECRESELRHLLEAADDWDRTMGSEAAGERSTADALARETGAGFALLMARLFPERDWVADLANSLGQKRSYVERHLQHDMMPPADLVDAAQRLVNAEPRPFGGATKQGLSSPE